MPCTARFRAVWRSAAKRSLTADLVTLFVDGRRRVEAQLLDQYSVGQVGLLDAVDEWSAFDRDAAADGIDALVCADQPWRHRQGEPDGGAVFAGHAQVVTRDWLGEHLRIGHREAGAGCPGRYANGQLALSADGYQDVAVPRIAGLDDGGQGLGGEAYRR